MTGTPLERQREANADAGALAAIRERIEASGVGYLYYQGVTISGRVIGKVVPGRHLLRNAERGVQLHRSAAADLQTTRAGQLLGDELSDLLVACKSDEWARFCGTVTDWEFQMYSEAAP